MSNQDLLNFFVAICIGSLTSYLAKERGRGPVVWFFIGLFFGIFGLIALFLFPIYKGEEQAIEAEVKELPTYDLEKVKMVKWFYLDAEHKQYGPFTFSDIEELWAKKEIGPENYIWNEEMLAWKKINEYPPLQMLLH